MKPIIKLGSFFSIFALLFYLFGTVINSQISHIAEMVENLHDHPMAVIRSSLSAARDMVKISRNINEILLIQDNLVREREIGSLVVYEKSVMRELEIVAARVNGEEGAALVRAALDALKKWQPVRDEILAFAAAGKLEQAGLLVRSVGDNNLSDIDSAITKISNYAVGQGMSYHAEGIEDLQKARVILLVAGLIIVLLFVTVAVLVAQSLLKPQHAVTDFLIKATENGLNLSNKLEKKAGGSMGGPLLGLIALVEARLIPAGEKALEVQKMIANFVLERQSMLKMAEDLENKAEILNTQSSQLTSTIDPVIDTVATFASLTKQIENDLSMIIQITSSQKLLISALKNSSENDKLSQILEQEKSIYDYVKNSVGIISQATLISQDLARSLKEIVNISEKQISLGQTIRDLRAALANITKRLDKVNHKVSSIADALQCNKNSKDEKIE